ncbi:MAG: diacylglycerol kinase family protein [Porphyromonadaceae bacterium]|nr:diacylglycerol kinase family protein [Porphyromonadaceae bacterium]
MNRFLKSFGYAWKGIRSVFESEPNMKIHISITVLVVLFGILFKISIYEWIAVVLSIGLVLTSEMFNTAVETLADKISAEKDPLLGKTKDIAAGAVLISAIISAVVGLIIFVPKVLVMIM